MKPGGGIEIAFRHLPSRSTGASTGSGYRSGTPPGGSTDASPDCVRCPAPRRGPVAPALGLRLAIAAESAVLTTAFAKVGFSGDYGGTYS